MAPNIASMYSCKDNPDKLNCIFLNKFQTNPEIIYSVLIVEPSFIGITVLSYYYFNIAIITLYPGKKLSKALRNNLKTKCYSGKNVISCAVTVSQTAFVVGQLGSLEMLVLISL